MLRTTAQCLHHRLTSTRCGHIQLPKAARRALWTTRTTYSNDANDLLTAIPQQASGLDAVTLFSISRNTPPPVLQSLCEAFQKSPGFSLGCLSYGPDQDSSQRLYSLSYAIHTPSKGALELCVPFRSTLTGIPKIALGREVRRRDAQSGDPIDMQWAGDAALVAEQLPQELRGLEPNAVQQLIFFSDDQPQGLMRSLDEHLPRSTKLGVAASSTPFVTGRPHTLIYGGQVFSSGAVGIAVLRRKSVNETRRLSIRYDQLESLGDPTEVTIAKGNIIMELAGMNATKLLLERIQQGFSSSISKEEGFYLGILPSNITQDPVTPTDMTSIRPIMAGDPKRGALSLDTEALVQAGQRVQFFHSKATRMDVDRNKASSDPVVRVVCVPNAGVQISGESLMPAHVPRLAVASEHGYIVGQPLQPSWFCAVECSEARLIL